MAPFGVSTAKIPFAVPKIYSVLPLLDIFRNVPEESSCAWVILKLLVLKVLLWVSAP